MGGQHPQSLDFGGERLGQVHRLPAFLLVRWGGPGGHPICPWGWHLPRGGSTLPSTALNQGPGVAPRWTRATAIPRRGRTRAQREPVSRRGSEHREWGDVARAPRPRSTPRGKPAVLGLWVWPAALSMLLGALAGSEGFPSPGQSLRPCFVWAGHPGAVCPLTGHPRACLVSLTLNPSSDRLGSPTGLGGGPSCLGEDCLFVPFLQIHTCRCGCRL